MNKYTPEELVHNYAQHTATEDQRVIVESWHIHDLKESKHIPSKEHIKIVQERMWNKLKSQIHLEETYIIRKKIWPKVSIAAAILLITSVTLYINIKPISKSPATLVIKNDITPGGNIATLTLNNGERISLNQFNKKSIAIQEGINIHPSDGLVIYDQQKKIKTTTAVNKLETPRGGKYQLVLPDGTRVWLNSASTLTYPTSFQGKERIVRLEGEAYFEVTKNKNSVFKVVSKTQTIEVLGTHFNIKSYKDEKSAQTTLAEGKVKISKGSVFKILKSGQAAINQESSKTINVENADLEKNLAWKNNEFIFNGDDLMSIMKEVSRWYNVEVIYDGNINPGKYWGAVSRSKNISEVLKMLQLTGKINYKIEGRRITLMN